MFLDQFAATGTDILRLVAEETGTLDRLFQSGKGHFCQVGWGWGLFKEIFGDDVDPNVGTLGREDRRDKQLLGRVVMQGGRRLGEFFLQRPKDFFRCCQGESLINASDLMNSGPLLCCFLLCRLLFENRFFLGGFFGRSFFRKGLLTSHFFRGFFLFQFFVPTGYQEVSRTGH